jgi:hypothetical protein
MHCSRRAGLQVAGRSIGTIRIYWVGCVAPTVHFPWSMGSKDNKGKKKLMLNRETIRTLRPDQLRHVAAGWETDGGGDSWTTSGVLSGRCGGNSC